MSQINRKSFMAELRSLLAFMDAEDRARVLRRYDAMFDQAGPDGEEALIRRFGSPVRQVLQIEREYREALEKGETPFPEPAAAEESAEPAAEDVPEAYAGGGEETFEDVFASEPQEEEEPLPPAEPEAAEEETAVPAAPPAEPAEAVRAAEESVPAPPIALAVSEDLETALTAVFEDESRNAPETDVPETDAPETDTEEAEPSEDRTAEPEPEEEGAAMEILAEEAEPAGEEGAAGTGDLPEDDEEYEENAGGSEDEDDEDEEAEKPGAGRVAGAVFVTIPMLALWAVCFGLSLALGLAVLAIGLGIGAAGVYLSGYVLSGAISFMPDMMLVAGGALVSFCLALLLIWAGLWIAIGGSMLTVRLSKSIYRGILNRKKEAEDDE